MLCKIIISAFALYSAVLSICVYQNKDSIIWGSHRRDNNASEPVPLNSIIDRIPEGIIVVDCSGRIKETNQFARRFFYNLGLNYSVKSFNIKTILAEWPDWLRACDNMQSEELEIETTEFGMNRHYMIRVTPVLDQQLRGRGSVSIIIDITNQKNKEEEKIQLAMDQLNARLRELQELITYKDKLFAALSHDIRNPMANMVSLVALLSEDEAYYSEDNREIFLCVKDQVNHNYKRIENLLEWMLSQKTNYEPSLSYLMLCEVIQEIIEMHVLDAERKKICITIDIEENMQVYSDISILEMVLRNILSNAIKFTDYGGMITIRAFKEENKNLITVRDTGVGMSVQQTQGLFGNKLISASVGTAGEKGLGIGLLLCNELIVRIGGRITVDSKPGKGTTFCLSLPVHL